MLTVAGTNGKGSCVVMLHALFRSLGERVGAYTSPHILRYEERIRIDDAAVTATDIVAAFRRVEAVREAVPLTYFEFGTLAAFVLFADAAVDTAVLEVGLGGRLDAVNVLDHDGCIITNVSMDHSDYLGDTIDAIAREKAGVMRGGRPAVFGSAEPPRPILEQASRCGAGLRIAGRDFRWREAALGRWHWQGRTTCLENLAAPALTGRHQYDNAAAVLALVEALGGTGLLTASRLDSVLPTLSFAGRQQRLDAFDRHWLLDGAHNEGGAQSLADTLASLPGDAKPLLVLGVLADKDAGAIVRALAPFVRRFVTFTPPSPRARAGAELGEIVARESDVPVTVVDSAADALELARLESDAADLIVVAGSFYTLEAALRWLGFEDARIT